MGEMKMKTSSRPLAGAVLLTAILTACGGGSGATSGSFGRPTGSFGSTTGSSSDTTSTPSAGGSDTAQPGLTLAQQIEQLERKGGYPTLDRSDDIAGPDANKNGVRDDIEAWINALNVTEPQRQALMQDARSTQRTLLVDLADKAALQRVGEGLMAATKCSGDRFEPAREESYPLSNKIEAMTANTRARAARYMQYNRARSGSSTSYPRGDTCES
jgi:hypothetical protein